MIPLHHFSNYQVSSDEALYQLWDRENDRSILTLSDTLPEALVKNRGPLPLILGLRNGVALRRFYAVQWDSAYGSLEKLLKCFKDDYQCVTGEFLFFKSFLMMSYIDRHSHARRYTISNIPVDNTGEKLKVEQLETLNIRSISTDVTSALMEDMERITSIKDYGYDGLQEATARVHKTVPAHDCVSIQ